MFQLAVLLYNNDLLPAAALPLPNRGLAFGDGFFETLIWEAGRLRLAADHLARMQRAAAALHLTLPPLLATAERLETTLARLVLYARTRNRLRGRGAPGAGAARGAGGGCGVPRGLVYERRATERRRSFHG